MTTQQGFAEGQRVRALRIRYDIEIRAPVRFVEWYLANVRRGPTYYQRQDLTTGDPNTISLADLGWAVLLEGRPSSLAAMSLIQHGPIDITDLPDKALHHTTSDEQETIVDALCTLISLPGLRSSIASKMLHPKRRHSVPVLDNQAIFGSFCRSGWRPGHPRTRASVRQRAIVADALADIHHTVAAPGNQHAWEDLEDHVGHRFSRIELFDMLWWVVSQAPQQMNTTGTTTTTCSITA